ncbi:hypothetical protein GCM10010341_06830 [Streptomyces noursei]|nr:hypothetical protein GCM10010341_06830 [Streptomyces noursei]
MGGGQELLSLGRWTAGAREGAPAVMGRTTANVRPIITVRGADAAPGWAKIPRNSQVGGVSVAANRTTLSLSGNSRMLQGISPYRSLPEGGSAAVRPGPQQPSRIFFSAPFSALSAVSP